MLYTINNKFGAISILLIILFGLGYGMLAFFLRDQHQDTMLIQEAVTIERDVRTLHDLFYEVRFWERAVLFQNHPEADKKFGIVIELFRERVGNLHVLEPEVSVGEKPESILKLLAGYEEDFNHIIQFKTEQRLNRTRMDTGYQSLVFSVLRSDRPLLFKPLFNLTHFLTSYRIDRRASEYQALLLVVDYLEKKLLQARLMDSRIQGYVDNFRMFLAKDFELEQKIRSTNERFDVVSTQLMRLMAAISSEAEAFLREKFLETSERRNELDKKFLVSTGISVAILLLILAVIARKIIYPIRSMASVMKAVKNEDIAARFDYQGNKEDEIVALGFAFNDMLDTIQENNEQLIGYQDELEEKIQELAAREGELHKHREELETLVQERTTDLTVANSRLRGSLIEKDVLFKEIHHRVKNNLQIISSLLKLQARQARDARATALFQDSQNRITCMALIHEQLYRAENLSKIDLGIYIRNLVDSLQNSIGQGSRRISVHIGECDIFWGLDVAIPCGLIINELVTNSLKYAFPAGRRGAISITVRADADNAFELVIGDDGIGLPENLDFKNTETFGLQLLTDLVEHQLAGKVALNRSGGTEFRIRFKPEQSEEN